MIELLHRSHKSSNWLLYFGRDEFDPQKLANKPKISHLQLYISTKNGRVIGYGVYGILGALKRILGQFSYKITYCEKE